MDIYVGDIGTIFRATIKDNGATKNVSTATKIELTFRKPNGTVVTKSAIYTTDGTDGKIQYTTILGDLDISGRWVVQGYIESPSGRWHTSFYTFLVYENI